MWVRLCLQVMHSSSKVNAIDSGCTVLKESEDLLILGVMFDAKMTFEKHLHSVSSAAVQRLGIMIKSCQVFHDRWLLLRSLWSYVLPVLEYCSAVWCSAANSYLKLLDRVVRAQGCWFFNRWCFGVQPCQSSICGSVVQAFKIKSNPMHPLSDALPMPYMPVRVTRGASDAHSHSLAPPCCRTSQYHRTFVSLSVSLWNNLGDPVFDGVGLAGSKSRTNAFLLAKSALSFSLLMFYLFIFPWVAWGWGLQIDRIFTLSQDLELLTLF